MKGTKTRGPGLSSARGVAWQALSGRGEPVAALNELLGGTTLGPRDRALATELTYGTLKLQRALGWSVQQFLRRPLDALDPALRWVLLLGAYQLLYLNRIPAHSAVDESVRLARTTGHAGTAALANATLRALATSRLRPVAPTSAEPIATLGVYASLPDWIAKHFVERFGFAAALSIAGGINASPRRALWINPTKWTAAEATRELLSAGIEIDAAGGIYGIPECIVIKSAAKGAATLARLIAEGHLAMQSEESLLAVHLLDPAPGQLLLDVCAGRGMKTAALAARATGGSTIYSIDDDAGKLASLRSTLARTGGARVVDVACDAQHPYPEIVPKQVDAAMVDAPCTALGIVGRRPDVRWRKKPGDVARFGAVQRAVLSQAASHVRPGGRLLYVTCSTHPQEDEGVIEAFLQSDPDWKAVNLALGASVGSGGPARWLQLGPFVLTVPGIAGSDGFFYAKLERAER